MDEQLRQALNSIEVSTLSRAEWINVGMALKESGENVSVWDEWSKNDERYHHGECERLWESFKGSHKPVKAGTIIAMAKSRGWLKNPTTSDNLDWDSEISYDGDIQTAPKVNDKSPVEQLEEFLRAVHATGETIDIVSTVDEVCPDKDRDKAWAPCKGGHSVKVADLLEDLKRIKGTGNLEYVLGTLTPGGAWVRINPVDGKGHGNANVTSYRYALVECDTMSIPEQQRLMRSLNLPIASMTYSGGKSIHALVKIDAPNAEEYTSRVTYLYEYCKKNGLAVDEQNKNPSRLTRLPGVMRGDKLQELLATNVGCASWDAWKAFTEGKDVSLPKITSFGEYLKSPPPVKPELIKGILRESHKLALWGPSKAGKSFALIEMCLALATGDWWLGWQCVKSKVIYINMELDEASCFDRFKRIAVRQMYDLDELSKNLYIWNLRGYTLTLDDMMSDLIITMRAFQPKMVVFDPIYKILTGDENSASDMGHFVSQFDKLSRELGCAIAIAHHHKKGKAGDTDVMDRGSGSGVFARDPDAIIDLNPIELAKDDKPHYKDELNRGARPFKVNTVLREFKPDEPFGVWFDYPIHTLDSSLDRLLEEGKTVKKSKKKGDTNERDDTESDA